MKLGNIVPTITQGSTKFFSKDAAVKVGSLALGAVAYPVAYDVIRSKALMRVDAIAPHMAQGTPAEMVTRAALGLVLGGITAAAGGGEKSRLAGLGMAASGVGSVVKDLIARYSNPAAAATQAAVQAAEQSTGMPQYSENSPIMGLGLAGLSGAAVAIEQPALSGFSGASVAIEQNHFASSLA